MKTTHIYIALFVAVVFVSANCIAQSIKAYDVVINEIMADPTPVIGLPPYEYIELHNRTDNTIDLSGWYITVGTRTKTFTNITIEPKGYLLITDTASAKYFSVYGKVYGLTSLSINNTGTDIILSNSQKQIISAFSFSNSWYGSDYKKDGGWSLEQIDPMNPCGGEENWTASKDKTGGSPCRKNSVDASNPDNTVPDIERVAVIDSVTIKLFFTEPLDSIGLKNILNYSIDNNIGFPLKVQLIAPFYNSLILSLSSALKEGIIYHVTISNNIIDCSGNASQTFISCRFALPSSSAPNDIIINEILSNPKDNGAQFVEIYNRSQKVIDIKSLLLCSMDTVNNMLTSEKTICDEGYLIFPGEYFVLTTDAAKVKQQYYTSNPKAFICLASFPQINYDDGIVVVSDKPGNIIDKLVYRRDMHFALLNDTKGISLERLSFEKQTQDKSNWHSAAERAGYATPAYKNSQYNEIDISDNAVAISPEIFSPDNDGKDDIVSISYSFSEAGYAANVTIYDSRGRLVRKLVNNSLLAKSGSFVWDGINDSNEIALIGIYVVYFEVFNLKGAVKHYKKTVVLGGRL